MRAPLVVAALLAVGPTAVAAQAPARAPSLADELLRPARNFLPMPLTRPMIVPQQEAPGVVVSAPRIGATAVDDPAITRSVVVETGVPERSLAKSDSGEAKPEERPLALATIPPDAQETLPIDVAAPGDIVGPLDPQAASLTGAIEIPDALLKAAAENTGNQLRLSHYAYGAYQRGLYGTAFNVALKASADNDAAAAALIGRLYEEAKGVELDYAKAAGWYAVAADLGNTTAQFRLGAMLLRGRGMPKDPARAAGVFEAAAQGGSADAAHALAVMLLSGEGRAEDSEAAFAYMSRAAELGDPRAQYALAIMYEDGQGTLPDDEQATLWFGRSAASGDPAAAFAYAERRLQGVGAPADAKLAAPFLAIAARAGNPSAMNLYARLIVEGDAVAADEAEAIKWHLLARRQGVSDLYLDGFMGTRAPKLVEEGRRRAAQFTHR